MAYSKIIFFIVSILITAINSSAVELIGLSTFPIKSDNFDEEDCKQVIKMARVADNPAIAILFNTFGSDPACLEKFWNVTEKRGKRHVTEIHFSNEAGRRTGNVDNKDFLRNLDVKQYNKVLREMPDWLQRRIERRVKTINRLIRNQQDKGYFILSTGLEDNYPKQAWYNLYNEIKKHWRYAIARSNVNHDTWVAPDDVWDERHAYFSEPKKANRCIMNGDGQDIDFLGESGQKTSGYVPATYKQVKKWLNKGVENNCIMFLWTAKWQGILKNKSISKPLDREFYYHSKDVPIVRYLVQGKSLNKSIRKKSLSTEEILVY